jgi:hypothetical protein
MIKKVSRKNYFLSVLLLIAVAYYLHLLLSSADYYASLSLTGVLAIKQILGLVIYLLMTPVLIGRMRDAGIRVEYVIIFWLSYFANVEMVLLIKQFMGLNILVEEVYLWISFPIGAAALVLVLYLLFKPSAGAIAPD